MEQVISHNKGSATLTLVLLGCAAMVGAGFFFAASIFSNTLPKSVSEFRDVLKKEDIKTLPGLVRSTKSGLMTNALFVVRSDSKNRSFHLKIYSDDKSVDEDIKNNFYTDPLSPRIARVGTNVLFFGDVWSDNDPLMIRIKEIFYNHFIDKEIRTGNFDQKTKVREIKNTSTTYTQEEDAKFVELDKKAEELTGSSKPTHTTTTPKVTLVVGNRPSNKPQKSMEQVWVNEYGVDMLTVTVIEEKPCGFEAWTPSFEIKGDVLHLKAHSVAYSLNCPSMPTTFSFTVKGLAKKDYTISWSITHEGKKE